MKVITVKVLKVCGLDIVGRYVGLPVGKVLQDANVNPNYIPPDKLKTLTKLVRAGDQHAKILRQVIVHFEITAPRYWWQEMDTYQAGVAGYSGHSALCTPYGIDDDVNDAVDERVAELYNTLAREVKECGWSKAEKIRYLKSNLPGGFMQTQLKMFSYQTLRRIAMQRWNHRLPEWHEFLTVVKTLPYAEELIYAW